MRAALTEFLGIEGEKMPYLPPQEQDKNEKDWLPG
jgi:hypothetical protein